MNNAPFIKANPPATLPSCVFYTEGRRKKREKGEKEEEGEEEKEEERRKKKEKKYIGCCSVVLMCLNAGLSYPCPQSTHKNGFSIIATL